MIKSKLIGDKQTNFWGKGILKNNEIIFYEDGLKNKIKIKENEVLIERVKDYKLKMNFIMSKNTQGAYTICDYVLPLNIYTDLLQVTDNSIKIKYSLMINNNEKMNFIYNIEYSIDSE